MIILGFKKFANFSGENFLADAELFPI